MPCPACGTRLGRLESGAVRMWWRVGMLGAGVAMALSLRHAGPLISAGLAIAILGVGLLLDVLTIVLVRSRDRTGRTPD